MIRKLFGIAILLKFMDIISTYIALKYFGAVEINPITNYLISSTSLESGLLVNLYISIVALFALYVIESVVGLVVVMTLLGLVVINNLYQLGSVL